MLAHMNQPSRKVVSGLSLLMACWWCIGRLWPDPQTHRHQFCPHHGTSASSVHGRGIWMFVQKVMMAGNSGAMPWLMAPYAAAIIQLMASYTAAMIPLMVSYAAAMIPLMASYAAAMIPLMVSYAAAMPWLLTSNSAHKSNVSNFAEAHWHKRTMIYDRHTSFVTCPLHTIHHSLLL